MSNLAEILQVMSPFFLAIVAYFATGKVKNDKEKSKLKVYEWKELYDQQKKIILLNQSEVESLTRQNEMLRKKIEVLEEKIKEIKK